MKGAGDARRCTYHSRTFKPPTGPTHQTRSSDVPLGWRVWGDHSAVGLVPPGVSGQAAPVHSKSPVIFRDLRRDEFAAARRIIATAFAGEAFAVGMFGESSIDRLVGMIGEYATWPWAANPMVIGAQAADLLIGVGLATAPGECHLCDDFDESAVVDAPAARIEREFQLACRQAHLGTGLPPHGHISAVASDPFIHGSGVGRRIVGALIDRIWMTDAECAVLECLTTRAAFYEHVGFRRVVEFDDPGGPELRAVLMRIGRPSLLGGPTTG